MEQGMHLRMLGLALFLTVLAAPPLAGQQPDARLQERIFAQLAAKEPELIEIRRDLHRHPEVSGAEERTARVVSERLRSLGLEVRSGVAGHGVVGILRGSRPGPLVAFRADMDAVPSNAPDPVEFRSLNPGVRHICGHDIHTTVGLALAEAFAAVRDELAGSVMLLFQPAEERATGAKAMLADGVFAKEKPGAIFAVHTAPLPVGQLGTAPGVLMPARDRVLVALTGSGDLDKTAMAVRDLIQAVGNVGPDEAVAEGRPGFIYVQVARPTRAADSGSVSVRATITLAEPSAREAARRGILGGIEKLAAPDVRIEPLYEAGMIAGVTNDPAVTAAATGSIKGALGQDTVVPITSIIPAFSEDFGSFQEQVPGAFYFLGVSNPAKGWVGMPHTPGYVADEGAILVGARAMAAAILGQLGLSPR